MIAPKEPQHSSGIVCPECGGRDWKVSKTRPTSNGVRRIRHCRQCERRLITYERPAGEMRSDD